MENVYLISKSQYDALIEKIDLILSKTNCERSEEKEWLSSKEAMNLLGISQTTLWSYRKQGLIKGRKIGHKLYFNAEEINQLIQDS